jgi:tRNA G18 (ribose-2'-O)-methylase SpoU
MPPTPDPIDLAPFGGLKKSAALGADGGAFFVCEGRRLVEEAIRAAEAGQLRFISLLCESGRVGEWEGRAPPGAKLLALGSREMDSLLGFAFHRGVLCCCAVPDAPDEASLLSAKRLLALPQIDNIDNLGQLVRTAAALGMDAVLLGRGPDPFSRRCVRVSMGAVWKMPILKRDGMAALLDDWLRHAPDVRSEIVGTAAVPDAAPFCEWRPAPRTALVLGPESSGLDAFWQAKCAKHVRIPLARQIDSLNVAAAGAVMMGRLVSGG